MTTASTAKPPTLPSGRLLLLLLLLAAILGFGNVQMTAVLGAEEVEFSYDPASDVGPEFWKDLEMENNQCGGTSNSPIALSSQKCTSFADYKFTVRPSPVSVKRYEATVGWLSPSS
jgi:carbonic anhydrase